MGTSSESDRDYRDGAAGTPIFQHLGVPHGPQWQSVRETLDVIATIHGDGSLPRIGVVASPCDAGGYLYSGRDGRALRIEMQPIGGTHPHLTFAQEIGHFLDHQALGARNTFASDSDQIPEMMNAIQQSESIRKLSQRRGKTVGLILVRPGRRQRESLDSNLITYLLTPHEQFGRAYAQYVAVRSGNTTMMQQLNRIRSNPFRQALYYEYWSDADFVLVAEAFDTLFRHKGWIV